MIFFFFSSRRRHTRYWRDWSSDVCSSDLDGGWTLAFRGDLPVEAWNAQVSLLTGRCAAALMLDGGVGLLRTLPPARPQDVQRLRLLAPALGVEWPDGAAPGAVIAALGGR